MAHMNRSFFFTMLLGFCGLQVAKADSPVTSTDISSYYMEYEMVAKNVGAFELDATTLAFLLNDQERTDVKAAVINALGWGDKVTDMGPVFRDALTAKYGTEELEAYQGADLMCLAYLMAMDDYFNVAEASKIMDLARQKSPESATVAMIRAVIKGQEAMDTNWCEVWMLCSEALQATAEPRDMKTAAIQNIVDYMILYKSYCY